MGRDAHNWFMMRVRCYIFLTTDARQPRNDAEHNSVWIEKGNMGENASNTWSCYEKQNRVACVLGAEYGSQLKKMRFWPI